MKVFAVLVIGSFALFVIIFYAVREAVKEGVLHALQKYDKLKVGRDKDNTNEQGNASD